MIERADFVRLCRVINPDVPDSLKAREERAAFDGGWAEWIAIRDDGVYFRPPAPEDQDELSPSELAAIYDCPITDPDVPALAFPCTEDQLQKFLEDYGLYGCIDPFDFADWREEKRAATSKQAIQEKAIIHELGKLGFDPKAVHQGRRGAPGPKATTERELKRSRPELFEGPTTFNKAWERLRAKGLIADEQ